MSTPTLRDVQHLFWGALNLEPVPELTALVSPRPTLTSAARIKIYADMYFWRLLDVMREDFPRVATVLGDDEFARVVRTYLAAHPSRHPSVRHLGGAFAAWLASGAADPVPGCLADLGRLERARVDVFDAPDVTPLTRDDLAQGRTGFAPIAALEVGAYAWPVHHIWAAAENGAPSETFTPSRTVVRVWRKDFRVYHAPMEAREEAAIAALCAGEPFDSICEQLADGRSVEEAAQDAGALLLRWIDDGILRASC